MSMLTLQLFTCRLATGGQKLTIHGVAGISDDGFGHEDVVAGDFGGHFWSERGSAGFQVAEVAIKGREGSARADNAEVDGPATPFAKVILGGIHYFAAQAGSLARRIHAKETEVATVGPNLNIDAPCEACGILCQQEFSFLHVGPDAVMVGAVALNEGLLDAESSVDQAREGFRVR